VTPYQRDTCNTGYNSAQESNMAESVSASKSSSEYRNLKTYGKACNYCGNCDISKTECQKISDELKSVQLILELLHSEINLHDSLCRQYINGKPKDKKCVCVNQANLNDMDEDQQEIEMELYFMAIRPRVRQILIKSIINIGEIIATQNNILNNQNGITFQQSYSEALANTKTTEERKEKKRLDGMYQSS
jgi:hypothetical protein